MAPGDVLLECFDRDTARINLTLPASVNYFGRMSLKIDGKPVTVEKADWSLDPLQKNAQVSFVVISGTPITIGKAHVELTVMPPGAEADPLDAVDGAHTKAQVATIDETQVRSPADGLVIPTVHEGQAVQQGVLLGVVEPQEYEKELTDITRALNSVDLQLAHATDAQSGELLIGRDQYDKLLSSRAGFVAKLEEIELILGRLQIHSPVAGIVRSLGHQHESNKFQKGEELFRIGTGTALLEDILFPNGSVNNGDALVVETPTARLPGRAIAVNQTPFSSMNNLGGYQAVEVMAFGHEGILQSNLPVTVILPQNDKDRLIIADALFQAEKLQGPSGAPGPPPPSSFSYQLSLLSQLIQHTRTTNAPAAMPLFTMKTNAQPSLTLQSVASSVRTNPLNSYIETTEYQELRLSENAAYDTRLSLFGGPVIIGNQIKWNAGISGMFANSLQGGLQSGNAINAASSLVFNSFVSLRDILDGRAHQEKQLAIKETEKAGHHKEAVLNSAVDTAQDLLINIGATQEKTAQLTQTLNELNKARSILEARANSALSTAMDVEKFDEEIKNLEIQISALRLQEQQWTIALNFMTGQSNTNLDHPVIPSLPWSQAIKTIDDETMKQWMQALSSTNSPNPEMREARIAYEAAVRSLKLQKLEDLPTLDTTSVGVSSGSVSGSAGELSPKESSLRTSVLEPGLNSHPIIGIDLFDSAKKRKKEILDLQIKQAAAAYQRKESELKAELQKTAAVFRSLSEQEQAALKAAQNAYEIWTLKDRNPSIFLAPDTAQDRLVLNNLMVKIIDLEAQALRAQADLERMGFGDHANGLQTSFSIAVSDSVSTGVALGGQPLTMPVVVSSPTAQEGMAGAGAVYYQVGQGQLPTAFALMHHDLTETNAGVIGGLKNTLINDLNPIVRANALDQLLSHYQNDADFFPVLENTVLHSPASNPDVVWGIFKFMAQRDDHGIPFFVQIIHQAEENNNQFLAQGALKFLGDVLEMDPEIDRNLQPVDFTASTLYPQASREVPDRVLLTLMQQNPRVRELLLQGSYWTLDAKAEMVNNLNAYVKSHQGQQGVDGVKGLADFFYASIFQEEATNYVSQTFNPGSFGHLTGFPLHADTRMAVKIEAFKEANGAFLASSPATTSVDAMRDSLNPRLFASSQEAAANLLADNPAGDSGHLFYEGSGISKFDDLVYFKILGIDGQQDYIRNTAHPAELARILDFPDLQTSLQRAALQRLMSNFEGRLQVLKSYMGTTRADLRKMIEEEHWPEILKSDIPAVKYSADNRMLRSALQALYNNTQNAVYLNLRLATYSIVELHSADDPRGKQVVEAQIKRKALEEALKVWDKRTGIKVVPWAGYTTRSVEETSERETIRTHLAQEISPVNSVRNFEKMAQAGVSNPKLKDFYTQINNETAHFADYIGKNDQGFRRFNLWEPILYGAFFSGALLVTGWMFASEWYKRKTRTEEEEYEAIRKLIMNRQRPINGKKVSNGNGNGNGNGHGNGKNNHAISVPVPDVLDSTEEHFNAWAEVLSEWDGRESIPPDTLFQGLNKILNCAVEVVEDAPYKPDLMFSPRNQAPQNVLYQNTYTVFDVLIYKTLLILKKQMKTEALTETQQKRLGDAINTLFDHVKYGKRFSRILAYRGNIDKIMSYKLPDNKWIERIGLNPFTRWFFRQQHTWKLSQERLYQELDVLLEEGNSFSPGLYGDHQEVQDIKKRTREILEDATKNGSSMFDMTYRNDRYSNRWFSFAGRVFTMVGLGWSFTTIFAFLVNFSWMTAGEFDLLALLPIAISFVIYYYPQYRLLKMKAVTLMDSKVDKLEKEFKGLLPNEIGRTKSEDMETEIVKLNQEEGQEQVEKELHATTPSVDLIVIIPQDKTHTAKIEEEVADMRGKLIRERVPVEVITSDLRGSGTVFLDVMEKARQAYEKRRHKGDTLRTWDEAQVLFVFHGQDAFRNSKLEGPLLRLGLTNGIRSARKGRENGSAKHQAGFTVVTTREAYYGEMPMSPESGVVIATSRAPEAVLPETSLIHATTEGSIKEVLEDISIPNLRERDERMPRPGRTKQYLEKNYELDLPQLEQYQVSNGIFLFAPDAVKVLEKTREYVTQKQLWDRAYRLTSDFIVPMVMGNIYHKESELSTETK